MIEVADTVDGLHSLTREVRTRLPGKLVAISGSAGKTTTKELLAAMLAKRYRTARNPGNLNNLFGFPLSLLAIAEDTEWMVAEMGMSTPGELGEISRLGKPDVAVLTNVYPVHLEFFGSLRGVADAKAELLEGLADDGLLVANRDDREVTRIAREYEGPVVWFGAHPEADYRAEDVHTLPGGSGVGFRFHARGEDSEVSLPLHGAYNIENFLAAAACAHALGVSAPEIVAAAEAAQSAEGRGVLRLLSGNRMVIDDSYNSNPDALRLALESARELPGERYWAVLGDMLELGPKEEEFHRRAGKHAASLGFSPILGVGPLAKQLVEGAAAEGAEARWFEDAERAALEVGSPRDGDVVLVKGSRGVGLEAVVRALVSGGLA